MQSHTLHKSHPDTEGTTETQAHPFGAMPAFPCALPAEVAGLRPQFMAEPDDCGDTHHEAQ